MRKNALDKLLRPQSVALIGASETSRVGKAIVENLAHSGYRGAVYPVNPKYDLVAGVECYPSIGDVPEPVDAVLIGTGASSVPSILEACGEAGAGSVIITADGFGERGAEGTDSESHIRALALRYGMAVVGPNCMGVVNTANGASLYIGPLARRLDAGEVGVVLQSGSMGMTLLNSEIDVPFRYVISSGNEAVLTAADYVEYLAADDGTTVIALVLESVRDPDRLLAAVRAAKAVGKNVVLLKLGTSEKGRLLAESHTGALAGRSEVTAAVCRQVGIGRVRDLQELLMACLLLVRHQPPAGNRVGCLTLSGGFGALFADLAERRDLELPDWSTETAAALEPLTAVSPPPNPFDAWGSGAFEATLGAAIGPALQDPATDLLIVAQDLPPPGSPHRSDVPTQVVEAATDIGRTATKPLLIVGATADPAAESLAAPLRDAGIPYLAGGESVLGAISGWVGAGRPFPEEPFPKGPFSKERSVSRASTGVPLDAAGLRELGIPVVEERFAATPAEARAAAADIGYPVVMKVDSDDIAHKSDVGGVIVGIGPEDIEAEFEGLLTAVRAAAPSANVRGVTLQALAPPGVEMLVGAIEDPDWGWVVSCGLGGVYTEVLKDVAFRRVPVTDLEARAMVADLQGYPLLAGARGREPADIDSLAALIESVGDLVLSRSDDLSQVDFNPVVVHSAGRGVSVVDRLLVPARSSASG